MLAATLEEHLEVGMDQAHPVHAHGDDGLAHLIDHLLFEDAGTDAAEGVIGSLAFDNDIVDTGTMEQLPKQEVGETGADACGLGFHGIVSPSVHPCPAMGRVRFL
ncbi:hypothetical protein GCM10027514_39940 [Azotobacter armeniacus]